jgi:hypothetical protein
MIYYVHFMVNYYLMKMILHWNVCSLLWNSIILLAIILNFGNETKMLVVHHVVAPLCNDYLVQRLLTNKK